MIKPHHDLLVFLLAPFLVLLSFSSQAEQQTLALNDIKVEDGDTIIVTIEGKTQRVQLSGIDAPEDIDNPKLKVDLKRTKLNKETLLNLGKESTEQLRYLIKNNAPFILHFNPNKRDRYGRIPGDIVNTDKQSIPTMMIKNGYAIVALRSTKPELIKQLKPLQQQAVTQRKGLWGHYSKESRLWAGVK